MLEGWHKTYNIHAYSHITKPVEFPVERLGVSDSEVLDPILNSVKYPDVMKKVVAPELHTKSYEATQIDGQADPISEEDFAKSNYYGDVIASIGGY